ncbi:hypothetical protein EHQ59_11220 [Leptospira kemamanensis]|uniref:Uncharacterized protein n=1 Tax=Leptospira kemamanensis TaxID=2484942 RepID=A0A4V3JQ11_9LEPT|nr:hypothetical protein [Leptospira kemamanensis]TGL51460.1 hypothetical protein EHQ59_11220 [Leptospira kemamanensis]
MKQTLLQTTVLIGLLFSFSFCQMEKQVSESEANQNLLVGLLAGSAASTSFLLEYNGQWNVGYSYDAEGKLTGTPTGRLIISTNSDGSGSIISSDTSGSSGDITYRILSFDKTKKQLFYQNTPGSNNNQFIDNRSKYGRIDYSAVTSNGCELSSNRCFYFCEAVSGKTTLAEVLNSTVTSNTNNYATNGCGGFTFSRALSRAENSTWTGL